MSSLRAVLPSFHPQDRAHLSSKATFPAVAGFAVAALSTIASLAGVLSPATYARDSASVALQGVAQDWVNLLVVVPVLVLASIGSLRRDRRARLVLIGTFGYAAYSYAVYAFGVHFTALFLVYCAALGLSCFGAVALTATVLGDGVHHWFQDRLPRRWTIGVLAGIAVVFAALWLSEIVPAIARGQAPASVANEGLLTNPVHVLDLSLMLPLLAACALWVHRGHPLGFVFAPALLTLSVEMAIAVGGMAAVVALRGDAANAPVAIAMGVMMLLAGGVLVRWLRSLRPMPHVVSSR